MERLPRLHVVTDDDVLGAAGFPDRARSLLTAHGPRVALHLRAPRTPVVRLHEVAVVMADVARATGALLLVNDRVDVALAVDAAGVQLAARSLPAAAVRELRADWRIGVSAHGAGEAATSDADFIVLGTIWETASHPGRPGAGLDRVREASRLTAVPVVAIGGVTPERAARALEAGAYGVAVIRGVWSAPDPIGAAGRYLAAMNEGERGQE